MSAMRNSYKILVTVPKKKKLYGKSKRRWDDIKRDFKEM
jgi:hypothetical protein